VILSGIEKFKQTDFDLLKSKRVGLMTNLSAIDNDRNSTYSIFVKSPQVDLKVLFSPEHGFYATAPDATAVEHSVESETQLPIYSLYGETYRPTTDMLSQIDVLVCDIQDVGVRFYTYIWTVSYILEACGEKDIEVIILDRPNPLSDIVDGTPLDQDFASFVGRYNIPIQHGMTIGELAKMFNQLWNKTPVRLTVVPCENLKRTMIWAETGLPFQSPSPAIRLITMIHYPGSCLIEGTNLSEGRGTPFPFEVVAAPFIESEYLIEQVNRLNLSGVSFEPCTFVPFENKYAGETCFGVKAIITNHRDYRPIEVWLSVIATIKHLYPENFCWLETSQQMYERGDVLHFDRLMGSDTVRLQIEQGVDVKDIISQWDDFHREFKEKRREFLIY